MLNGGFELTTLRYWHDPAGPEWFSEPGYASAANITDSTAHRGEHSLQIRGAKVERPEHLGRTGQDIPIRVAQSGIVKFWVKASELEEDALRVTDGNGHTIVSAPAGTYDWTEIEGPFQANDKGDPRSGITTLRLEIVSAGQGEAWLDDLEVHLPSVEETKQ